MNLPSLLCRAGLHAPLPAGRWNGGYCFTTCRRCGRDMVRSAFGEWHVPRGHRVVWKSHPPEARFNGHDTHEPAVHLNGAAPPPVPLRPPGDTADRSPFDFDDFG